MPRSMFLLPREEVKPEILFAAPFLRVIPLW